MPRSPSSFLPFKEDVLYVLLALDAEPLHGYAIIKDVERRSSGAVRLQTGALYRSLKQLLADNLIVETDASRAETSDDERRRYYRTTKLGAAAIDAELERMAALLKAVKAERARSAPKHPRLA